MGWKEKLYDVCFAYHSTRRHGHTDAMIKAVKMCDGVAVVSTEKERRRLQEADLGRDQVATLDGIRQCTMGVEPRPVLWDFHAVFAMAEGAAGLIDRLQQKLDHTQARLEEEMTARAAVETLAKELERRLAKEPTP